MRSSWPKRSRWLRSWPRERPGRSVARSGSLRARSARSNRRWCWRARPSPRKAPRRKASKALPRFSTSASPASTDERRVAIFSQYSWVFVLIGAGIIVWRLYVIGKRIYLSRDVDDWDSKQVRELRSRGKDPFKEHSIDFF